MTESLTFVRIISVDHPPPSAKRGRVNGSLNTPAPALVRGSGTKTESPRSLMKPRRARTATGRDAVKVKVPLAGGKILNGDWSRNAAICPFAGTIVWASED